MLPTVSIRTAAAYRRHLGPTVSRVARGDRPPSPDDPAPAPEVSVAIVSWNTRDLLRTCLASLEPDARSGIAEVWVVDNASHDGSAAMVAEDFPWVRLIASEENIGFGPAINMAAARMSGGWLAIANADIALRDGALAELLDAGRLDPGAGAIAPRLVLPDGSTQHSVFPFPTVPFTLLLNLGAGRLSHRFGEHFVLIGSWDHERARRVPWAVAAFLLVRREAWEQLAGFDEHQWMYAEDLDLGWRLHRAGWATRYVPQAVVDHHSAASTTQAWGDTRTERWQRSTYAWMSRRRGTLLTRVTAAINVLGCATRWAALTPAARIAPARWAPRRAAARWWMGMHAQGLSSAQALREHR
jgi:N-acetylglucosaminyl-diphospho-decaprenol L-rhamnosyltransferase